MFSVRSKCFVVIIAVAISALTAANLIFRDISVLLLSIGAAVWMWLYLHSLKIEITADSIIKNSGSLIRRKTVIMRKNIFSIQILSLGPQMPAVIRIQGCPGRLLIIGLNGRQADWLTGNIK